MTKGHRGRPPKVEHDGRNYRVTVKGQEYRFRYGGDFRLRALDNPSRSDESYQFARRLVLKYIEEGVTND